MNIYQQFTKAIILILLLGGFLLPSISSQAASDPYAKYRGAQLNVLFPDVGHHRIVEQVIPEFTQRTGIKVNVKRERYLAARKIQAESLKQKSGQYDLISYVVMDKGPFGLSGGLQPLGTLYARGELNNPDYDILDLIPAYVENIGMVGGEKGYLPGPSSLLVGLPFGAETSVLGYRKDILDKYSIKVPQTYQELIDAMCLIHEKEPNMYGITSRGARGHQIVHAFLLHMAPFGVRIFDDKFQPVFAGNGGQQVVNVLKKFADCGHPNMKDFGSGDAQAAFRNGETAFYLDTTIAAGGFDNPEQSKVAGKVGWTLHPVGTRRGSQSGGFGIGIPANSQNKEVAFLFLQWLTSKDTDKKITQLGGSPIRISTMIDPDLNKERSYLKTFREALKYSDSDWRPLIPEWDAINAPILGQGIHDIVFNGADTESTLKAMSTEVYKIMEDAGYYNFTR